MERNTQKNSLVNLVVALVIFLACLGATVLTGALAARAASIFLLLGLVVSFVSWFQTRLEENERSEKLELDELARSRGASLFESKDSGSFPAQNARLQFEKYFVPAFTILLILLAGAGALLVWKWSGSTAAAPNLKLTNAVPLGIFALLLFLFGRFSVTIARLENNRLLRPSAGFLLAGAYVCAAAAAGIAGAELKFPRADFFVARLLTVLLVILAVEYILTLLLELYRPRVKGRVARPLYESRVAGILAQPESLFTTAAQTLDYQFGFKVSETWFFQAARQNLVTLLLIQVAVLILSTSIVFIDAGEKAILENCGKYAATLEPGAHFKFPWPLARIYRYRTEQIQSFAVGYTPDEQSEKARVVLWTVAHAKEENFLVANRAAETTASDTGAANNSTDSKPVGLLTVSIPIQFQITNISDWVYRNNQPEDLLHNLAAREVTRYLAGSDLNNLLSHGRLEATDRLRTSIQDDANDRRLGVKIVFVGLQDIHPPTENEVAATYEKVVSAEESRLAAILNAEATAVITNTKAGSAAFSLTNTAEANRITLVTARYAQAGLFTNQIPAFKAAPSVYRERMYLQAFNDATKNTRKYIVLVTNTDEVVQFDLEEKVRADLENLSITNN